MYSITNISSGEKERMDVAWLMYLSTINKVPPILLFDEITANLDEANKNNVYDILFERFNTSEKKICFIVSHQVELKNFDKIIKV